MQEPDGADRGGRGVPPAGRIWAAQLGSDALVGLIYLFEERDV